MGRRLLSNGGGSGRRGGFSAVYAVLAFLGLTDTPKTYAGQAGKIVTVNPGETGLEFDPGRGVANGVASLDGSGKLPESQLPALAISDFLGSVNSQVAMLALVGQRGDWAIRTDLNTVWILINEPSSLIGSWQQLVYPGTVAHAFGGAFHTADTIANIQTKASDGSFVTSKPSEISTFANKAVPAAADLLVIEDSASANAKKNITISSLPHNILTAKINITHTMFQVAALTNTIALFDLPAGSIVIGTRLKPSTTFLGGAIANYFLSIGLVGGEQDLMTEYDAMNIAVADTEYAEANCFQSFDYNNVVNLKITARSIGANLSASSQGAGVVEVIYIPKA